MKLPVWGLFAAGSMALMSTFAAPAGELAQPFRVVANGDPIDVDVGHAAPFFADFDGDKLPDLLVGQFGGGKLRIFRNEGSSAEPKFVRSAWFQCAGALGTVPAS
jgi:hypothetical protein